MFLKFTTKILISVVRLQTSATNGSIYYLYQLWTVHENYNIFTFSPSFCAAFMKQNVNPVPLISKKVIARIVKTLLVKALNLQTALP